MEALTYSLMILACLMLSGLFSGSETALLRVREHELEEDIRAAHGPAAVAVRDLIDSTSRLLVTILLGNNLVNIMAASAASVLAVRYLGEQRGVITATLLMTLIIFVFCEVLPKAIAAQYPRRVAYAVALPLYLIHQLLRPLHLLYDRVLDPLVQSVAGGEGATMSTAEEIMRLARKMPEEDDSATPVSIIGAAAKAADMRVSDVMVPRTEIVAFPAETSPSDLLDEVLEERYTRVPVYQGSIDDIIGVVHLKDLAHLVRHGGGSLHEIAKPVLRVPERKPILWLLADMQRAFVHAAIVKDEFNVTLGLVTQEDILEELVGEIRDEFDREELLTIRRLGDDSYQAIGRVKVLDFNRETGWKVIAERGDTLAGLVFNQLGRAPRKGDTVHVPDYEITVADVSGSRVREVRITRRREDP